jgi:hypothetical protein
MLLKLSEMREWWKGQGSHEFSKDCKCWRCMNNATATAQATSSHREIWNVQSIRPSARPCTQRAVAHQLQVLPIEKSGLQAFSMVQYEYASEKRIPFDVSVAVAIPMSPMALIRSVGGKKAKPGSQLRSLLEDFRV